MTSFRTVTGLIDSFSLNASLGRMNEIPQASKNKKNNETGGLNQTSSAPRKRSLAMIIADAIATECR